MTTRKDITGLDKVNPGAAVRGMRTLFAKRPDALPVAPNHLYLEAQSAPAFAGARYRARLHAQAYVHVNRAGAPDSNAWAVLLHPNFLNGRIMAERIGPFYYERGFNLLAPDLRSFGKSSGKVALGFLEALDTYDWLQQLNRQFSPKSVVVHGLSLGGATVNFLSGIHGFFAGAKGTPEERTTAHDRAASAAQAAVAPATPAFQPLASLHVTGLVADGGYTNLGAFGTPEKLGKRTGIPTERFAYLADARNSLRHNTLPMLVIQGARDTLVAPENARLIAQATQGPVTVWDTADEWHIFVLLGNRTDEYRNRLHAFLDSLP
ncbi:MAG: alpha/beta hydrolase [Coriobacteriia bacterium]|nr:alpha/beta hydrolase [Coriobacteriia bacterium]